MEKEKLQSLIIDYIDNNLNDSDRRMVEEELKNNLEAFKLYEQLREVIQTIDGSSYLQPSSSVKMKFDSMLAEQIRASEAEVKTIFFQPSFYRVAAAIALLVVGAFIGYVMSRQIAENDRMAAIEKELEANKRMMLSMMTNELSASQRIQGVNVAMNLSNPDVQIVDALVKAMLEDKNSNVRLAALDALSQLSGDPKVKTLLVNSLQTQDDPVVQIALIKLLVKMKEKSVVKDLQEIIENSETMKAVKDEAYSGLMRLS